MWRSCISKTMFILSWVIPQWILFYSNGFHSHLLVQNLSNPTSLHLSKIERHYSISTNVKNASYIAIISSNVLVFLSFIYFFIFILSLPNSHTFFLVEQPQEIFIARWCTLHETAWLELSNKASQFLCAEARKIILNLYHLSLLQSAYRSGSICTSVTCH